MVKVATIGCNSQIGILSNLLANVYDCPVLSCRTFQRRRSAETFGAVLSNAELSGAETCSAGSWAALHLGWLTLLIVQCTEHRRIAELVLFLIFKRSDSRSAAENAFCHKIATQGHSRSFILQSFAGQQGVAYRHIILLAVWWLVSLKFSKT